MTAEQERQLKELQALQSAETGGGGAASRFGAPAAAAGGSVPKEIGIMVPIEMSTERGKVTTYLLFDAAAAENPRELIERLLREGYPVKAWQPSNNGGGGGGSNWRGGGGGGYGGGRNRF